jgi:hypothetical protein
MDLDSIRDWLRFFAQRSRVAIARND